MRISLWPSGHSDDYSLVGHYSTAADAQAAASMLDDAVGKIQEQRGPISNDSEGPTIRTSGRIVGIYIYEGNNAEDKDDLKAVLDTARAIDVKEHSLSYREFFIKIGLPTRDLKTSLLMMTNEEVKAVQRLLPICEAKEGPFSLSLSYSGTSLSIYRNKLWFDGDCIVDFDQCGTWAATMTFGLSAE